MDLPVMPPVKPMLATATKVVPEPDAYPAGLLFERKCDGFRGNRSFHPSERSMCRRGSSSTG